MYHDVPGTWYQVTEMMPRFNMPHHTAYRNTSQCHATPYHAIPHTTAQDSTAKQSTALHISCRVARQFKRYQYISKAYHTVTYLHTIPYHAHSPARAQPGAFSASKKTIPGNEEIRTKRSDLQAKPTQLNPSQANQTRHVN